MKGIIITDMEEYKKLKDKVEKYEGTLLGQVLDYYVTVNSVEEIEIEQEKNSLKEV